MQPTLCFKEKFTGSRIYIRLLTEADADALLKFRIANRAFLRPYEGLQTDEQFTEEYVRNLLSETSLRLSRNLKLAADRIFPPLYGFSTI